MSEAQGAAANDAAEDPTLGVEPQVDELAVDDEGDDNVDGDAGAPEGEAAGSEIEGDGSPRFVPVEVVNVLFILPGTSPVVQLRESDAPYRVVDFPIGLAEAQAIALALEKEFSPRPSTAELLAAVVAATAADVVAVRLTGTRDGTVLAELDVMSQRGRSVLDCRPSDGIALALRQKVAAPILCEESLLDF